MVAQKAWIPAKGTYSIGTSNEPFNPTVGDLIFSSQSPCDLNNTIAEKGDSVRYDSALENNEHLEHYLRVASLANLAIVHKDQDGEWTARGDPTEIAIQVFASRFDWNRSRFTSGSEPAWRQVAEFPFDSDVKKMSVIFEETKSGSKHVLTKGAVERVITSCTSVYRESPEAVPMTEEFREEILENMEAIAALGLRVLALAGRNYDENVREGIDIDRTSVEKGLTFRGLVGLYDPPRPESAPSVKQCHEAGIVV